MPIQPTDQRREEQTQRKCIDHNGRVIAPRDAVDKRMGRVMGHYGVYVLHKPFEMHDLESLLREACGSGGSTGC
jgi:hypothetical protein